MKNSKKKELEDFVDVVGVELRSRLEYKALRLLDCGLMESRKEKDVYFFVCGVQQSITSRTAMVNIKFNMDVGHTEKEDIEPLVDRLVGRIEDHYYHG